MRSEWDELAEYHAWRIDVFDVLGVPAAAHCLQCSLDWTRPQVDPNGDSLTWVFQSHVCDAEAMGSSSPIA